MKIINTARLLESTKLSLGLLLLMPRGALPIAAQITNNRENATSVDDYNPLSCFKLVKKESNIELSPMLMLSHLLNN